MIHETTEKRFRSFSANLKDETQIVIREAVIQDAADFIRCVKSYISDSDYMVMEPEEFAPDTSQGREFIYNLLDSENSILLVATHNEKIVGNLDITGGKRIRLRHTGLVGMVRLKNTGKKDWGPYCCRQGLNGPGRIACLKNSGCRFLAIISRPSDSIKSLDLQRKAGRSLL